MALFRNLLVFVALGGFYAWVLLKAKTPPPVVIHCLFIGALILSGLRLIGRFLPKQPERKPIPGPVLKTVHDEVLGTIELRDIEGNEWWRIAPGQGPFDFTLEMIGEEAPDAAIVQHAKILAARLSDFKRDLQTFLDGEAQKQPKLRDEILNLKIDSLAFLWANKPSYGEIHFSQPPSGYFWGCAYKDGRLFNLSFDP